MRGLSRYIILSLVLRVTTLYNVNILARIITLYNTGWARLNTLCGSDDGARFITLILQGLSRCITLVLQGLSRCILTPTFLQSFHALLFQRLVRCITLTLLDLTYKLIKEEQ